jgi:tryptophan-rich sensory protein
LGRLGPWAAFLASSYAAEAVGSVHTRRGLDSWYQGLCRPACTPAGRTIGRVWTVLYLLVGVAGSRAWLCRAPAGPRRRALAWYAAQLGLNALWSAVFFGLRSPGAGLATLLGLWLAIGGWMRALLDVDRASAALAAPYLAGVPFAGVLNASIWRLNRPGATR